MTKLNIDRIREIQSLQSRLKDRLSKFVLNGELDEMLQIQQSNLKILFNEAKKRKVRYLYVGKGEIAGCENKRTAGWPSMWAIAESVGFPGSCGNTDQYQCSGSEYAFPPDSYGGWDLTTITQLTDEETDKKPFKRVVTSCSRF